MKNLKFLLAMLFLFSGSSCQKLLDTKPTDFLSPVNFYNTEEDLNYALNAVYSHLNADALYGANLWSYFDIADEMFFSLTSVNATLPENASYGYSASNATIKSFWKELYSGIGDANMLLANIDKPQMDNEKRKQIKGEALFLRAYYYFLLVQNYGAVPVVLQPVTSPNDMMIPRTSVKEVYARILQDMEEAEGLVLSMKDVKFGGRVTQSAVRGILARVCLYMAGEPLKDTSKWVEARGWAKKVIDDTEYQHVLNPSYEELFINYAADKYDPKESIWEAEFWGNRSDAYVSSGRLGSRNGIEMRNESTGLGWGYGQVGSLGRQYRRYEDADARRDWAIAPFSYSTTGAKSYYSPTTSLYTRKVAKWRREYEVVVPKNKNYTPQNFPILRYADVLLMYAEAQNELEGNTVDGRQKAIDEINKVRRRGYGKDAYGERVLNINISNQGSSYSASNTTVTINGGGGSGATAIATVLSGKVTAITVTNRGSFYTSTPTVTITSTGSGKNATATATITTPDNYLLTFEQGASQEDLRTTIREERSRELCFEALRKMDLIRWGMFVINLKQVAVEVQNEASSNYPYAAMAGKNVSSAHLLMPIPTSELSLNRLLTQNPGW